MKKIELTSGRITLVSDKDFEELNKYKWYAWKSDTNKFYAVRSSGLISRKLIRMHRVVMNVPDDLEVDHIDGDTLNNQIHNLRICSRAENLRNRTKQSNNTSGYKGVYANKDRWIARIQVDGKLINLKNCITREEVAHIYDDAAKRYFGEFANLNFPEATS